MKLHITFRTQHLNLNERYIITHYAAWRFFCRRLLSYCESILYCRSMLGWFLLNFYLAYNVFIYFYGVTNLTEVAVMETWEVFPVHPGGNARCVVQERSVGRWRTRGRSVMRAPRLGWEIPVELNRGIEKNSLVCPGKLIFTLYRSIWLLIRVRPPTYHNSGTPVQGINNLTPGNIIIIYTVRHKSVDNQWGRHYLG